MQILGRLHIYNVYKTITVVDCTYLVAQAKIDNWNNDFEDADSFVQLCREMLPLSVFLLR